MMRLPTPLKVAATTTALWFAVYAAANAQSPYYSTNFDSGTDTVDGGNVTATYNYPASAPINPLDNLNNWASNDGTTTTGTPGSSKQLVGRSDYVGAFGSFFGGTKAGAIGGVYRVATGTASEPDVVPSTNSGGIVTLYHPVSITPAAGYYVMNVDFALAGPGSFATSRDSFGFLLGSSAGNLLTLNFTPGANNADGSLTDAVGFTIGTTTTAAGSGLTLNSQYHLRLLVATGSGENYFTATISNASGSLSFSSSLTGSAIAATAVNEVGVLWNLADKTATSGAYQNAGSNSLAFDNLTLAVPEPSTYALLALGLVGLGGVLRLRRSQA